MSAKADFKNNYVNFRFGEIYEVKGLEGFTGSATRIVVETSITPETRIFLLENPYRLVIDTANTEWNVPNLKHSGSVTFGPVSSYRVFPRRSSPLRGNTLRYPNLTNPDMHS